MEEAKEMKKTSFTANGEEYEVFKKLCKEHNSDASKELRKFIRSYNQRHGVDGSGAKGQDELLNALP